MNVPDSTVVLERQLLLQLGDRLKRLRKAQGLGTVEMAKRAGISRTTLSSVESGDPGPAIGTYLRVMSVLGVSVPHYWLGMVLVIVFSSLLMWLPPGGAGPGGLHVDGREPRQGLPVQPGDIEEVAPRGAWWRQGEVGFGLEGLQQSGLHRPP